MGFKFNFSNFDNDNQKELSNGEKSEFNINYLLKSNKEYLIFDELDYGLDSNYINTILINKIKEIERGKYIFIATHSANLAVNSIPFNWIYREEIEKNKYLTYYGDMFSNLMTEFNNQQEKIWSELAIHTLEGGEKAFKNRGYIYNYDKAN